MKKKQIKRKQKSKQSVKLNKLSFLWILMSLLSVVLAVNHSLDLIIKDYQICEAVYICEYKEDLNSTRILIDDNSEKISVYIMNSDYVDYTLIKGERYNITYTKRTRAIISIEAIDE